LYCSIPVRFRRALKRLYPEVDLDGKCFEIVRALEGLKQSGHIFWKAMRTFFIGEHGFRQVQNEPCVFFKWVQRKHATHRLGDLVLAVVCTDDIRIQTADLTDESALIAAIDKKFNGKIKVTDCSLYMGVKHVRVNGTLELSQPKFIADLLKEFNMVDCHPETNPIAPGTKLVKALPGERNAAAHSFPYRTLVGALLWLQRNTKPEIANALTQIASHTNNPTAPSVEAGKRILRYLKGCQKKPLVIRPSKLQLKAFVDSDYCGELHSMSPLEPGRRSVSAIILYFEGGGVVNVSSTFQSIAARSTMEAEYVCAELATQKIRIVRNFLSSIGLPQEGATVIYEDNASCLKTMFTEAVSNKIRHVEIDHCILRQLVTWKIVTFEKVASPDMTADAQ
jgi:hypothetical protein